MVVALCTPCCRRRVGGAPLLDAATVAAVRTCPRCLARYSVIVRPMRADRSRGRWVHTVEWTAVARRQAPAS